MSLRQRVLRSAPLVAFALAIVFLGLSLGGYDPADPPGWAADPPNQPPANPCGPVGAVLRPCPVHQSRLVVVALRAGARGRQYPLDRQTVRARPPRPGRRLRAHLDRDRRLHPQARSRPHAQPDRRQRWLHRSGGRDLSRGVLSPDRHDPHPRRDRPFRPGLCHEVLFVWPFQELRGWISTSIAAAASEEPGGASRRRRLADGPARSRRPGSPRLRAGASRTRGSPVASRRTRGCRPSAGDAQALATAARHSHQPARSRERILSSGPASARLAV